jgi:Fe-S oxidoreductase
MSMNMEAFAQFREGVKKLPEMAPPAAQMSEQQRVQAFKKTIVESIKAHQAVGLETCVHCGMCAQACHYFVATQDAKYTPIRKLAPLRRVYHRELSPLRWLVRLVTRDITAKELEDWQELIYDSCTECGRCSLVCPTGVHIQDMIVLSREALANAGLAAAEPRMLSIEQGEKGTMFGMGKDTLVQTIERFREKGLEIPVDQKGSEILVVSSVMDMFLFQDTLEGTIKIMDAIGRPWTYSTCGYEGANFGYMAGFQEYRKAASMRVIDAAIDLGVKTVIVPECGHSYPALRWDGAAVYGKPLPFEVLAISEFIAREIKAGNLRVKPLADGKTVTFHDPCKLGRMGGVFEEPREALDALGIKISEADVNREQSYCCGGGAGNFLINRAAPLRAKVWDLKRRQFDRTGAEAVVTSCDSCRINFSVGAEDTRWDKPIESLAAMVGANLAE